MKGMWLYAGVLIIGICIGIVITIKYKLWRDEE